jgi:hypothetical protein
VAIQAILWLSSEGDRYRESGGAHLNMEKARIGRGAETEPVVG